jgi:glycosyltransferase involved in cell wall biosynthesis
MKLAWIAATTDPNVASFRYRCMVPAWALGELGHESTVFVDEMPEADQFDALIAVKNAGDRLGDVARRFRAQGKPVFLDLCDNVFIPGYAQRRGPELSADAVRGLAAYATALITPNSALERVARAQLGHGADSRIIPDAALTPNAYQAMCAWLPGRVASAPRRGMERLLSGSRRAFAGDEGGSGSAPSNGYTPPHDKHDHDMFGADTDWQVDHLPDDTARVIWFGRHGSFHSDFGMGLLKPVIAELERAHRERPIELVVISNNRIRFDALTHDVRIFTRYEEWSNERVFFELSRADLFVMPSGLDPFSLCKSANRAVLALANGVPVVASYLEALAPLRDALIIDDWRAGIDAYLFEPSLAPAHLALARPLLAAEYSIEAIGRKWSDALRADAVRVAQPPIATALAHLA